MAEGEGVLRMKDGSVYTGHFSKGKENGKGTIVTRMVYALRASLNKGKKMVLLSKQILTEK